MPAAASSSAAVMASSSQPMRGDLHEGGVRVSDAGGVPSAMQGALCRGWHAACEQEGCMQWVGMRLMRGQRHQERAATSGAWCARAWHGMRGKLSDIRGACMGCTGDCISRAARLQDGSWYCEELRQAIRSLRAFRRGHVKGSAIFCRDS